MTVKPRARIELRNVQALRAVAALLVVGAHVGGSGGFQSKVFGPNVGLGRLGLLGDTGVDVFFVISGFIMAVTTWSAQPGTESAKQFARRRLTRVYPPYLVITAVLAVIYEVHPGLINASQSTPPNVLDSIFLFPQDGLPLLLVGWTLTYEIYFYLIFALTLLMPLRHRWIPLAAWLAFTLGLSQVNASNAWVNIAGSPLNLEFLFGVMVGSLVAAGISRAYLISLVIGVAGIAGLTVAVFTGSRSVVLDDWHRTLLFGPAAALIVYGLVGLELNRRAVLPKVLVRLGDASYSLYLTHVIALKAIQLVVTHLNLSGIPANVIVILAVYVVVLLVAQAFYLVVEQPIVRLLHDRRGQPPSIATASDSA